MLLLVGATSLHSDTTPEKRAQRRPGVAESVRTPTKQAMPEAAPPHDTTLDDTDQTFQEAIRKLMEPLEEGQEFRLPDPTTIGRFDTSRDLSGNLGRIHLHKVIHEEMERHPAEAFEALMTFQQTSQGASLFQRLRSQDHLSTANNIDLRWIANQLKAINLLLDRAELESPEFERLQAEKAQLQKERWRLQDRYYGGQGRDNRLTTPAIQAALDPGTIVLTYFIPQFKTLQLDRTIPADHIDLFVIARNVPIRVHSIALHQDELESLLRDFLAAGSSLPPSSKRQAAAGQRLYDALITPAEGAISTNDRVLVIPDGLLYNLPFAALPRKEASGAATYFVEWKPTHIAQSIPIYFELLARREREDRLRVKRAHRLVAFGDPDYGDGSYADERANTTRNPIPMAVRFAVHRGFSKGLRRLPATDREVREIARVFREAGMPTDVFLGAEATEAAAKEITATAAYVHFASHGILDLDQYEHSYLALTFPKAPAIVGENGILEAWEVIDQLNLTADLATLSACETAVGRADYGEGVLSISHSFQMAGAQSVVASLWSIPDDATAELMVRFYRNLLKDLPKDRSLQEAQAALLRDEMKRGRSSIHSWAAFQLFGDWR